MKVKPRTLTPEQRAALGAGSRTVVLVRRPDGRELEHDGEKVPRNQYWMTRLRDNDVELVLEDPPKQITEPSTSKKAPRQSRRKENTDPQES